MKKLMLFSILSLTLTSTSFGYQIKPYHFPASNHSIKATVTKPIIDLEELLHHRQYTFAVRNPETGNLTYTLSGEFIMKDGYFYQDGSRLQGYTISTELVDKSCELSDIKISSTIPVQATTQYHLRLNLDSNSTQINQAFNANDINSFNYKSTSTVFDSLGNPHLLNLFFVKIKPNDWLVHTAVDDVVLTQGEIKFSTDGQIDQVAGLSTITFNPSNGASTPQTVLLSLAESSQYAMQSSMWIVTQNGHLAGNLNGIDVDEIGYVNAAYNNGEVITAGKIAVLQRVLQRVIN